MSRELNELVNRARTVKMNEVQKEKQRRSWAYGTAKIENDDITRESIDQAAERLKKSE
jgi:hypothetical protein